MRWDKLFFGIHWGLTYGLDRNPIQKIIELITAFQGKLIRDGEVEQKAYEEY